jgi:hypothetical protein
MPMPPEKKTAEEIIAGKAEKKALITVPDATDLPSAITLLNAIKARINEMNAPTEDFPTP